MHTIHSYIPFGRALVTRMNLLWFEKNQCVNLIRSYLNHLVSFANSKHALYAAVVVSLLALYCQNITKIA